MKRPTLKHPKTYALMRALKINRREALGLLTLLWDWTGEYAPDGNIGRYPDTIIATACDWPAKDSRRLIAALVNTGWVDRARPQKRVKARESCAEPRQNGAESSRNGAESSRNVTETCQDPRLLIHDWFHHCEQWAKKRLHRDEKVDIQNPPMDIQRPANGWTAEPSRAEAEPSLAKPSRAEPGATPDVPVPVQKSRTAFSVSGVPQDREQAAVLYHRFIARLVGLEGRARHPSTSPKTKADMTMVARWWDESVWPHGDDVDACRRRVARMMMLIGETTGADNPMALLTNWIKAGELDSDGPIKRGKSKVNGGAA
jgi:hypothetical protein